MVDSSTLEVLDREQCRTLLVTVGVGRVVFTSRAMPAVHPVRFVVHEDAVLFCVPVDTALFAGTQNAVVAFAAEVFDADLATGWCVTVVGRAGEVRDPGLVARLAELRLRVWGSAAENRCVRIAIEAISGWRSRRSTRMGPTE